MATAPSAVRLTVPFLPVAAGLFCIQSVRGLPAGLAFFASSVGLALCGPLSAVGAIGGGRATPAGIDATLLAVAALLLVAGIVTLAVETRRLRAKRGARAG